MITKCMFLSSNVHTRIQKPEQYRFSKPTKLVDKLDKSTENRLATVISSGFVKNRTGLGGF
jgi:hypothetical protein